MKGMVSESFEGLFVEFEVLDVLIFMLDLFLKGECFLSLRFVHISEVVDFVVGHGLVGQ
jgi:hypothetical protein